MSSQLFVLVLIIGIVSCDVSFMKPLFNTKTPYFWVKDAMKQVPEDHYSNVMDNGKACNVVGLNVIFRHGARFPTLKWIKRMDNLQSKLKGEANVTSKHPFILKWNNTFPESNAALVSSRGKNEMLTLGSRFGRRFKAAMVGTGDNLNFAVTRKARTHTSYEYFYKGLNETIQTLPIRPEAKIDNERLRFYDFCDKYEKEVEDKEHTEREFYTFLNGTEMTKVLRKVRDKLGYSSLSPDEILIIHEYCAVELGIFNKSEWCSYFDLEDLVVIDYAKNIQDYYEWGYAYPINWHQSCPVISDIFNTFDEVIDNPGAQNNKPRTDISFGHAETLFPLYAAFGLFRDPQPFLASNFDSDKSRAFHGSQICPFSANLATALFRCNDSNSYLMRMFVNEEPVNIPACGKTTCPYEDVKKYYRNMIKCDFDELCENEKSSARKLSHTSLIWIFVFVITYIYS